MTCIDPLSLDVDSLMSLIRCRLYGEPSQLIEDWRYGVLSPERRAALQRFFPAEPVPAAVLIPLIARDEGLHVILTERARHLTHHGGQVSFPGGRCEQADASVVAAALREAQEEIGLARERVEVIGYLPDHLIISGYRVTPVVGLVQPPIDLTIDPREVAQIFEVPLQFVLDPRNHLPRQREFQGERMELIDLRYGDHTIWGATAGMLLTLRRLLVGEDQ